MENEHEIITLTIEAPEAEVEMDVAETEVEIETAETEIEVN